MAASCLPAAAAVTSDVDADSSVSISYQCCELVSAAAGVSCCSCSVVINVTFLPLFIADVGLFYICCYGVDAASSVLFSSRCCELCSAAAGVSFCYCSVVANKCYLYAIGCCCRGSLLWLLLLCGCSFFCLYFLPLL